MQILAIDPGPEQSAWVCLEGGIPTEWKKADNAEVLAGLCREARRGKTDIFAIESIASYGMAVGAEVFETCVWSGRFIQAWAETRGETAVRVYRREVKLHLTGSPKAKDTNIRQAIIDRFGPGKEKAVGRKASPGPLYGLKADCWQALGVALTVHDFDGQPT